MNRNTEQLTISSGWVYLESATRYLEHGDFASARVLVEEGILQTEAAPRFEVLGRLRDLHTIIASEESHGDDTGSSGGRTTSAQTQKTTSRRLARHPCHRYIEIFDSQKVAVEQPTMRTLNP